MATDEDMYEAMVQFEQGLHEEEQYGLGPPDEFHEFQVPPEIEIPHLENPFNDHEHDGDPMDIVVNLPVVQPVIHAQPPQAIVLPNGPVRRRLKRKSPDMYLYNDLVGVTAKDVKLNPSVRLYRSLSTPQQKQIRTRFRTKRYRLKTALAEKHEVWVGDRVYHSEQCGGNIEQVVDLMEARSLRVHLEECAGELRPDVGFVHCRLLELANTYSTAMSPPSPENASNLVAQSTGTLRTYNGEWGVVPKPAPVPKGVDAAVAYLREHPAVVGVFQNRVQWCQERVTTDQIRQWAISVELSTESLDESVDDFRFHVHLWFLPGSAGFGSEELRFRGSVGFMTLCYLDVMAINKNIRKMVNYSGCFYVSVDKIGVLHKCSTLQAFKDYSVRDTWVTNLLMSGKITSKTATRLYLGCVHRCEYNIRILQYRDECLRLDRIEEQRVAVETLLRQHQKPFKRLAQVDTWLRQYQQPRGRFLFLVLNGKSQTGKTKFAFSLVAPEACYYCDCSRGIPDLRRFEWGKHEMIVLDEMSPQRALECKKLIQASNEPCIMGTSPTMQHSYTVYTWRTKFVISTNTWESGMGCKSITDEDREWLVNNAVVVQVDEPLWE